MDESSKGREIRKNGLLPISGSLSQQSPSGPVSQPRTVSSQGVTIAGRPYVSTHKLCHDRVAKRVRSVRTSAQRTRQRARHTLVRT